MFQDPSMSNIDEHLIKAQTQLKEFEDVDNGIRLARLRDAMPNHPFLLMRTVGFGGSVIFTTLLIIIFVAPMIDPKVARTMAGMDDAAGLPLPIIMLVLAGALGLMAAVGNQLALMRAQSAPLLPEERKVHQDLMQTIVRLQTKKDVASRSADQPKNPMIG